MRGPRPGARCRRQSARPGRRSRSAVQNEFFLKPLDTAIYDDLVSRLPPKVGRVDLTPGPSQRSNNLVENRGKYDIIELTQIINPKKTILTNMNNEIDYLEIKKKLPKNIVPAYDGMSFLV
mgnify:CR=1 FL=1